MCEGGEERLVTPVPARAWSWSWPVPALGQVTSKRLPGPLKCLPEKFSVVCLVAPLEVW